MMADIDVDELARVSDRLRAEGADVATAIVDVSLREDQQRAADQMVQAFGGVDILINNAGVGGGGPFERWNDKGWDWTVGVNLMSVIYGFDIFGRIMAQQGAGHIVSTASIAGMMPLDSSAYSATKFGVVAVSESLREELAPKGVGVSLLCPGFVNTNIIHSHRHLPERFGENLSDGDEVPVDDAALERIKTISDLIRTGHDPRFVGDLVCDGILNNHPYIFTDREHEPTIRARFEGILAAYERL
jgi:NAD(P)-dependent dehydrogenase (short-subunit alcohol dehydrogenase family)